MLLIYNLLWLKYFLGHAFVKFGNYGRWMKIDSDLFVPCPHLIEFTYKWLKVTCKSNQNDFPIDKLIQMLKSFWIKLLSWCIISCYFAEPKWFSLWNVFLLYWYATYTCKNLSFTWCHISWISSYSHACLRNQVIVQHAISILSHLTQGIFYVLFDGKTFIINMYVWKFVKGIKIAQEEFYFFHMNSLISAYPHL